MTQEPTIINEATVNVSVSDISEHPRNPNRNEISRIVDSIESDGFYGTILVQKSTGYIIAGNHRYRAAVAAGFKEVPVTYLDVDDDKALRILVKDNRLAELGHRDEDILGELLQEIKDSTGLFGTGFTDEEFDELMGNLGDDEGDGGGGRDGVNHGSLAEKFGVPPFTVLNAREGWWQDRKRAWIDLGIRSEIGRGEYALGLKDVRARQSLLYGKSSIRDPQLYYRKNAGEEIAPPEGAASGTSIFDPVLTELLVRWFCPPSGRILDPFAGGSVRGVVAGKLGRQYIGLELREEQVEANRRQVEEIDVSGIGYVVGDSRKTLDTLDAKDFDMVLTCPPYGDLEVYSDDPNDLSNMDYADFLVAYRDIIRKAADRLAKNRFYAIVVGEIRDKKGIYRNFVGDTVTALLDAGLSYYNEAILVTMVASASVRARRQFLGGRKLVKTHQNVIICVKGDPDKATKAIGDIQFDDVFGDEPEGGEDAGGKDSV